MGFDLLSVSEGWVSALSFGYGLIIGSFLNVFLYRFHTGKSLSGRSHCLSCGVVLRSWELVPLFSYLFLRGRCRTCGCKIPSRYFIIELTTAVLFTLATCIATSLPELFFYWALFSLFILIIVYDIRHFIIPDAFTVTAVVLALIQLVYFWYEGASPTSLVITVAAAALGTGFFFALWYLSDGRWIGFGDVKLAFALGLLVGAPFVFSLVVFSFWIGAAVSLFLLGLSQLTRGQLYLRFRLPPLTIKSVVPFAPFLVASCLVILLTRLNVLTIFTF